MDAISTQSLGSSFLQGFQAADNYFARKKQQDMQQQAFDKNSELQGLRVKQTQQQLDQGEQRLALSAKQLKNYDKKLKQEQAQFELLQSLNQQRLLNAKQANKLAAAQHDRSVKEKKREEVRERGKNNLIRFQLTGDIDWDADQEAADAGIPHMGPSYYLDGQRRKTAMNAEKIVEQVGAGNYDYVNEPEALEIFNHLYADQIQKGLGEWTGPEGIGKQIVGKRLSEFDVGPGGGVVAYVDVSYNDGSTERKPITINRSSNPDDPVKLNNVGQILDDLQGRAFIAKAMDGYLSTGDNLQRAQANVARHRQIASGKTPTITDKTRQIKELMSMKMSQDEAINLVYKNENNDLKNLVAMQKAAALTNSAAEKDLPGKVFADYQRLKSLLSGALPHPMQNNNQAQGAQKKVSREDWRKLVSSMDADGVNITHDANAIHLFRKGDMSGLKAYLNQKYGISQ